MKLIEYPDREALVMSLAQRMASSLRQQIGGAGRASLCLPGGTTPAPLLSQLSAAPLQWDLVTVFPGDERCVPPDHPRSNARLLRQHLMQGPAAAANLIELYPAGARPEDAAVQAAEAITPALPIGVLLLGMGADMHTASLFPGADGTEAALAPGAPTVAVIRAAAADEPRLSLTAPVLKGALDAHLMIFGPEKRAALDRAADLTPAEAPVRAVWGELTVHWAE